MNNLDDSVIEYVFNYFKDNTIYIDKQEAAYAGLVSDEEWKIQEIFDEFVFNILSICWRNKKYYIDEEDLFENYTLYIEHKNIKIIVFVLYGQGNYYHIEVNNNNFKEDLKYIIE